MSTEQLRRRNTATILRSLRFEGSASRTHLAQRTGLSKATVSAIVATLEAARAVTEDASAPTGRGRPARPVRLSRRPHVAVGLEVNVDYVSVAVIDLAGRLRRSETRAVRPGGAGPLEALVELARSVESDLATEAATVLGVTVAVPGLVAGDERQVVWTPNLGRLGVDLHDRVAEVFAGHCPVTVANDANCAALAEAQHGASAGTGHALYLTGTVGIGAGILDEGRLLTGSHGFAGEVGHMPLGRSGARCGCGRLGCWEATVGLYAMLAATGMPELDDPRSTAEAVAHRARSDRVVADALRGLGEQLGLGLSVLTAVLDPAVIVLGGYFVPLGDHVVGPVRAALQSRLGSEARQPPEVRLSPLGIRAAATGAAERSLLSVLDGSVSIPPAASERAVGG